MYALGVDIGTTSIAVARVDVVSGEIRKLASFSTPTLPSDAADEHMQDAAAIVRTVKEVTDALDPTELCAIGVSGQMHGIVYLDASGTVCSPLYTWQDRRGERAGADGIPFTEALGVSAGYGHATHAANRAAGLVPQEAIGYATIADAVVASLCGLRAPVLHASQAASLGCFDIDRSRFTARLCETLGEAYPYAVVGGYHIAGEYRGIPVAVAIGDNQASFLGSGCGEGEVLINIGTGSQISMLSDRRAESAAVETRPGFEGKYLHVGAALCGGRAYALLHSFFCDVVEMATGKRPDSLYEAMARYQHGAADASLRFDNAFCGSRTEPGRRASIRGLGCDNFTPQQFCIGLLEGMIDELASLYSDMGCYATRLVGAGNALRYNPLLQTLCEKRFGAPLYLTDGYEEAAVGAALFALISSGRMPDAAAARALLRA